MFISSKHLHDSIVFIGLELDDNIATFCSDRSHQVVEIRSIVYALHECTVCIWINTYFSQEKQNTATFKRIFVALSYFDMYMTIR